MKSQLKAKLLQHFAGKKANGGFTLIELLVVIIIIGILSAIALPSFLNQANKAKQSEAKTYTGSLNRAQQAYYLENDEFANDDSIGLLGLGIPQVTDTYTYTIYGGGSAGSVQHAAQPNNGATASVRAYVGATKVGQLNGEATTVAILCEADQAPVQDDTNADLQLADATAVGNALAEEANGAAAMTCDGSYSTVGG